MAYDDGLSRAQRTLLKQVKRDTLAVLDDPACRRFVMRLIDSTGVFARSYSGEAVNTVYREGQRSVGLSIIEQLEDVRPGVFALLQQEALALRQANERPDQESSEENDD